MKKDSKWFIKTTIAVVGLIAAIIAIYSFFVVPKKTLLTYDITANTNVLDINANLSKLDITYRGNSLKSSNENLRIFNVKVKNEGEESILKDYYDLNDPIGVTISNGQVVEKPELVNWSNDYLKRNLRVKIDSGGRVIFNDLIFEPNQYFTIKILVLHKSNLTPVLAPCGKIAGQNNIILSNSFQDSKSKRSLMGDVIFGNWATQLVRFILYGLCFAGVVIATLYGVISGQDFLSERRRINLVKKFKKSDYYSPLTNENVIFSQFIKTGLSEILEFNSLLENEELLNDKYRRINKGYKLNTKLDLKQTLHEILAPIDFHLDADRKNINKLIDEKYISLDDDVLKIDRAMKNRLTDFIEFLKPYSFDSILLK